jgi:amino acid adenylation domain-containing protein
MTTATDTSHEFWRQVLLAGGSTSIPRWTLEPRPGIARHATMLPGSLVATLRRRATEMQVPLRSVLLGVHARVLAELSGEADVVTRYLAGNLERPLPCRLSTDARSWRALVRHAAAVEAGLWAHRDLPLDDLQRELELTGPASEVVIDLAHDGDLPDDAVLQVSFPGDGTRILLRYRKDVLDAGAAARIAGYHVAALRLLAADPDADPERQSLLSAEELRLQVEGMAGPHRELPDRRVHQLFEERVRAHPGAVAAVHGDRQITYGELNARANRVARALLARGLRREGVVAVVTERNLDWLAAVLGIWKAGGAYLPIEPHFPAERIRRTMSRAGCGSVLTEPASRTTLDAALRELPGIRALEVGDADAEGHAEDDLDLTVGPGRLAYVYFTSGSTGEPKGAMCEHGGMLNHVLAKIDDLGIDEGSVVAQTAPQCFDISLWQLVSALVVGGRTLLVEQDVILDVERFVERIVDGRVGVLQVVPSYLEAVLSYLEQHPRRLPDLRCVSATGEALKTELVQRWFAAQPGIPLVNAYGLTETSDDTNHEVMRRGPDHDRVPLGRPIANVFLYVVDRHLTPVPLGAPGEIVFSGICVGRGYVNDPERTGAAFLPDPHRPGQRLYRSGDHGRWLPDGTLDYLGRRDDQVKIRGFRIEIGEIENALLRVPGVHDGAVVVPERADGSRRLVAFYTAAQPHRPDQLCERLAASLPGYMLPTAFHWRPALPVTANGKIDRTALTALAGELDVVEDAVEAPSTPTEQRVAAAWARVLGVPADQIGRRDDFFERGGTSLTAVKLAVALDRAVSLKDLVRCPVLADLAELVDGAPPDRAAALVATR